MRDITIHRCFMFTSPVVAWSPGEGSCTTLSIPDLSEEPRLADIEVLACLRGGNDENVSVDK